MNGAQIRWLELFGFAEEEEATGEQRAALGACEVGGGGDSAEENEKVEEGAKESFFAGIFNLSGCHQGKNLGERITVRSTYWSSRWLSRLQYPR